MNIHLAHSQVKGESLCVLESWGLSLPLLSHPSLEWVCELLYIIHVHWFESTASYHDRWYSSEPRVSVWFQSGTTSIGLQEKEHSRKKSTAGDFPNIVTNLLFDIAQQDIRWVLLVPVYHPIETLWTRAFETRCLRERCGSLKNMRLPWTNANWCLS